MANRSKNHEPLLRTIHELRLADLEMLNALCVAPRFSPRGIRWACDKFVADGTLHRLWKHRGPKFRMDRGSARQVFLLSDKGAARLGIADAKASERCYRTLKDPRTEHRIEHELMVARFHASLLVAQKHHPDTLTLDVWDEGQEAAIKRKDAKQPMLIPDARFRITSKAARRQGWFFLEADTGNERLESDDDSRRTIEKKIRRYGEIDSKDIAVEQFKDMRGFSVLFVVPRRADPMQLSGREQGVLDMIARHGQLEKHARRFYRVLSETDVEVALSIPTRYFTAPAVRHVHEGRTVAEPLVSVPDLHDSETPRYAATAER